MFWNLHCTEGWFQLRDLPASAFSAELKGISSQSSQNPIVRFFLKYFIYLHSSHCLSHAPPQFLYPFSLLLASKRGFLPSQVSLFTGASDLSRIRCILSHWGQITQSSAIYVSYGGTEGGVGGLVQPVYAVWLVAQSQRSPRGLFSWDWWSSYGVTLPFNSFSPPLIPPWVPQLQSNDWV